MSKRPKLVALYKSHQIRISASAWLGRVHFWAGQRWDTTPSIVLGKIRLEAIDEAKQKYPGLVVPVGFYWE